MPNEAFLEQLGKNWGWIALRGVAAVIFGVLAFAWPVKAVVVLVLFFGAYALVEGIFALITAFKVRDRGKPMWTFVAIGILGVAAGILTFLWPGITALALLTLIAVWAFFMGIFQIVAAVRLRKEIDHEWLLGLSGVLSVIFGAVMLARPVEGLIAVIWIIAAYSVVFGILLITLAYRLKNRASGGTLAPAAQR
ncbi:MAG: HdeD family acid-resistance protein [Burkholderiales bacterium]